MTVSIERAFIDFYKTTSVGRVCGNAFIHAPWESSALLKKMYERKISYDIKKYNLCPDIIKLESSNLCNAQCLHCPQTKLKRPKGIMSYELFVEIAQQAARLGIRKFQLSYFGEPLIDPDIIKKIRYAKQLPFEQVRIYTNASLLTTDMADALLDAGLDVINISVDGLSKDEYEKIRTPLSYDVLLQNIHTFIMKRDERNKKKPCVVINHVAMNATSSQTAEFLKLWRQRADIVKIHTEHNWGGHLKNAHSERVRPCSVPWSQMIIHWNGKIGLCCQDALGSVILGDLSHETLKEAWHNEQREQMRRYHLDRNFAAAGVCSSCNFVSNWL